MRKFITEEMGEQESWYAEAKEMTAENLPEFVRKLSNDYSHDMKTIAHAMTAASLASIAAINRGPEGGLSPDQSKAVMGLFIRKWSKMQGPLKLTSWYGMMHPDNEPQFNMVPKEVFADMQKQAVEMLAGDCTEVGPEVVEHLKTIVEGKVPFGYRL